MPLLTSNDLFMGPIGVFDSGYGGLTVLREFVKALPRYDYLYLGDNARTPYGTRSFETVYRYTPAVCGMAAAAAMPAHYSCLQHGFCQGVTVYPAKRPVAPESGGQDTGCHPADHGSHWKAYADKKHRDTGYERNGAIPFLCHRNRKILS